MTNLEAKKEAIKKAYGEYWELVKDYVDENGWIDFLEDIRRIRYFFHDSDNIEVSISMWRPKSLKGIENNNGWRRIESEADLPKENTWCFVISKISGITHGNFLIKNKDFWLIDATHYQPIEQPKPPIF